MARPGSVGARLYDRTLTWAERRQRRIGGHNPWTVAVHTMREIVDDRVSGLAAEMAFFALLSLVPLCVTLGAALGYLERVVGPDEVLRAQTALVRSLAIVFSPRTTSEVLEPFVRALLSRERGGVAVTGLLLSLYLASRVFTATIRALDLAYDVPERRGAVVQRLLAFGFAIGFVVAVTVTLTLMVVGPLLGGGRNLATRFGLGSAFEVAWSVGRWPLLLVIVVAFLACVYRFGPAVEHRWRDCVPGAVLGVVLWLLSSIAFRLYLQAGGGEAATFIPENAAVALVARVVGAMVATILWTYLTGFAILVGGELNAELQRTTS